MSVGLLLLTNASGSIACYLILWFMAQRLKDVTFVAAYWPLGMVLLAWNSFFETGPATPRKLLLAGLCALWGLRLAAYLNWRWQTHGPDRRYQALLSGAQEKRGWSFAAASLTLVIAPQALLQFVVCLPVQLGMLATEPRRFGLLATVGAELTVLGLIFETAADWQLARFKAAPANRGRVLDTGLWRYSRHPNYFGDACVWWGLWMIAAETRPALWSLAGPIVLTLILTGWRGASAIERDLRLSRPGYDDYARRTSRFFPLPPKRMAAG